MRSNWERNQNTRRKKRRVSPFRVFILVFLVLSIVLIGLRLIMGKGLFEKLGWNIFSGDIMKEAGQLVPGSSEFMATYPDSKRINVLLLGTNEDMTDTIMLASFDTENKLVDVISIPRDSYYERPDYPGPAHQKINAIYKDEGPEGTARAVSKTLGGMPIHYYAVITDE